MGRAPEAVSIKAIAARLDGRTLGVAGLSYGKVITLFANVSDELRQYPVALVRAGKMMRDMIKLEGRAVYSAAENDNPMRNARFLEYLGGEYSHQWNGMSVYVWEAD